ncbi:MAG: hypothetical protein ABL995_16595 [Bryobacteraceae bacterium]
MAQMAASLMALISLFGLRAEPQVRLVDVCDVFKNRSEWNGQMILLRGIVGIGPHGTALFANKQCPARIYLDGIEFPAAVWIKPSPSRLEPGDTETYLGEFQTRIHFEHEHDGFGEEGAFPGQLLFKRTIVGLGADKH